MNIKTKEVNDIKVVVFEGNLDTNSSPEMENYLNELIGQGVNKILISFEELGYISSAGLRVLLSSAKQLHNTDGKLRICCLNEVVQEIFDISGFSSIFSIYEAESEALNDF